MEKLSVNEFSFSVSNCDESSPFIVGGAKTKNGEFPHMAAIGWRSLRGLLEFKCGGSLISELFVLTAAHCMQHNGSAPSIVRLGDQNLRSRNDGLTEVDVPIAELIKHENYRSRSFYDDIALIRMIRSVVWVHNLDILSVNGWKTFFADSQNSSVQRACGKRLALTAWRPSLLAGAIVRHSEKRPKS